MISENNANEAWVAVLGKILIEGLAVGDTIELLNNSLVIPMANCIVDIYQRRVNFRFMAGEAAYILSGRNDIDYLTGILPRFAEYADDGTGYQMGAYGPPFVDQLPYILDALKTHSNSRQAVLSIWRPRPYRSKDIPCTLTLQYLVRDHRLHLIVNMRSSDAWVGLVYDMFCFGCMGAIVAKELGVETGNLYMNLGSSHIYSKDLAPAAMIYEEYKNLGSTGGMSIKPTWRREMVRTLQRVVDKEDGETAYELMRKVFG